MHLNHYIIIDTSGDKNFFAYVNKKKLSHVYEVSQQADLGNHLTEVFNQASLDLKQVQGIGVCIGPGRFSATRVGIAFALGLSASLQVPLVGFSALEGYLTSRDEGTSMIFPLSKKGGIFVSSSEFSETGACLHQEMGALGHLVSYEEFVKDRNSYACQCLVSPCVQSSLERMPSEVQVQRKKRSLCKIRDLVVARLEEAPGLCPPDYRSSGSSFF